MNFQLELVYDGNVTSGPVCDWKFDTINNKGIDHIYAKKKKKKPI